MTEIPEHVHNAEDGEDCDCKCNEAAENIKLLMEVVEAGGI
jgi:hypothetical protein